MSVNERTAIIAGASGGLGRVASKSFAEAGANLVLLGRGKEKLDAMVTEIGLPNEQILTLAIDLGDPQSVDAVAQATLEKFGRIDILLNLVGGWIGGKALIDTRTQDFEEMFQQHILASYVMLKSFVPHMLKGKWGRILAISSPNASRPLAKQSPYAVGKAGMEALLLSLAREIKGSGLTANMLLVNTIDVKHERENNPSSKNRSWTTPVEISATLLHLCSEEAGTINGARIPLYGSP